MVIILPMLLRDSEKLRESRTQLDAESCHSDKPSAIFSESFHSMDYFYETQPNPNPYSYFAHHAPKQWHQFEVLGNHLVELVCPLLTIVPFRWAGMTNGFAQTLFQILLILSGNLSFLNWLTVLPSIWFFDDAVWSWFFSSATAREIRRAERRNKALSQAGKWQGAYRDDAAGFGPNLHLTM